MSYLIVFAYYDVLTFVKVGAEIEEIYDIKIPLVFYRNYDNLYKHSTTHTLHHIQKEPLPQYVLAASSSTLIMLLADISRTH